jgi:endoglucanase
MRRLVWRAIAALAIATVAIAGCATRPDTSLHPDPPLRYAPLRHPFNGAVLYRDTDSAAAKWQASHGNPSWLDPIVKTPQAIWLTSPQDLDRLPGLSRNAHRRGELLLLTAYYLPGRGCTADGARSAAAYLAWIDRAITALGETKAVFVVEPDAVAADCFNPARAALLTEAVKRLAAAGHFVYIDAGHPRWRSTGEMAERLIASGIQAAEGFSVNVSNRQATADSYAWGRELSDLVGDRDFVIDTSRNGIGPPPGNEWCNPEHQALGAPPTTAPGQPHLAARLWIKRPGESDGLCGGEDTYGFSPRQAKRLIEAAPR